MTAAQDTAFQAGSGVTPATLLNGIASVVLVLAFIWVIWVSLGTFRAWQNGQVVLFDVVWSMLRASIVLMVLGFYFICGEDVFVAVPSSGNAPVLKKGGNPRYLGEKTMMNKTAKRVASAVGLLAISATQSVWAALPTPVAPSTALAAGDWIALISGYIKDGGMVLGLAIAVLGFLWIAYLGFAKFNEARQGKAEWAEVGVLGIVGAIVLIFASYLLTEAAGVI
jgi:integrating conjugative element membrane protein (TIGR03745 family)/integrating conjugative element protein (TIGR03758 family)